MSDREILFRSLGGVAARLSWSRRVPALGDLACALIVLLLFAQVLAALGVPSKILSALTPLLAMAAIAVLVVFVWRIGRRATLAQAAGAADARGGLRDELKSAYWFALAPDRDAYIAELLTRAAQTAQTLDARNLIPLAVPRSAHAALVLAVFAGALAWFSPRLSWPGIQGSGVDSTAAAQAGASRSVAPGSEFEKMLAEHAAAEQTVAPEAVSMADQKAKWAQLEQEARQLPAGAEEEAIRRAVAARDARLLTKLLQALRHKQADAAELDASRRSVPDPDQANSGKSYLDRLEEALADLGKSAETPWADDAAVPTARITQQIREQAEEERRAMTGTPAEGDVEFNPRMRAVNRSGVAMREMKYAAGEAAEAGAQTSVDGNAIGPPDGKGRSGGSSGEHPEASFNNAFDPQPVLAAPTARLDVRMREMRVERTDDLEEDATTEEFYAETQRRASQLDYESVNVRWREQQEAALQEGRTPLSFREAVKRYFLTQHGKEEPAR
jgi:hypothetical protein